MSVENQTVVVTGASRGLGRAMADSLVSAGASVVYAADERLVKKVAAEQREASTGGAAVGIQVDVSQWSQVRRMILRTEQRFGDIDVLVNNAGTLQYRVTADRTQRSLGEVPVDAWRRIIGTNLTGLFYCTKATLPGMLARDAGRLIHISSGYGIKGRAEYAPYVASKFGLEGLHESLSLELEGSGVSSVALRPPAGGVYTESSALVGHEPSDYACQDPSVMSDGIRRLVGGKGDNGGRYQISQDGDELVPYGGFGTE